jgi:hypothetical protein
MPQPQPQPRYLGKWIIWHLNKPGENIIYNGNTVVGYSSDKVYQTC